MATKRKQTLRERAAHHQGGPNPVRIVKPAPKKTKKR